MFFGLRGVGPAKRVSAVCVHRDIVALGCDDLSVVLVKKDATRSLKTKDRATTIALYGEREILFVAFASRSGVYVVELSADSLAKVKDVTVADTYFDEEPECSTVFEENTLAVGVGRIVFVYDQKTTKMLKGHRGTVTCLSVLKPLLISTSQDQTFRAWNGDYCVYRSSVASAPLTCLATSTSSRIVTGSADGKIRVYEWLVQKQTCVEMISVDSDGLLPLAMTLSSSSILLVATASHLCVVNVLAGTVTNASKYAEEAGVAGRASFSADCDSGDKVSLVLSAAFKAQAFLGVLTGRDFHQVPESAEEEYLSFFSRRHVPDTSPLLAKDPKRPPAPKRDLLAWDSYDKQKSRGTIMPVLFHSRIKSSGYGENAAAASSKRKPRGGRSTNKTMALSSSKPQQQYPIDCGVLDVRQPQHDLNVAMSLNGSSASSLAIPAIACSEDAKSLAIATNYAPTLIHPLPISAHIGSGGGRPIVVGRDSSMAQQKRRHSVSFSHDCRRLITTGADGTVEIWPARGLSSKCIDEPELTLSPRTPKSNSSKAGARFFYLDKFILRADGSSLEMYAFDSSPVASKNPRGVAECSPRRRHDAASKRAHSFKHNQVQNLTAIGCVNSELSPLIVTAGSNRAVHILDAATGGTARIIEEAHAKPVHWIALPVPTSATPSVPQHCYEVFATASTDGIVTTWDIRTQNATARFSAHVNRREPVGCAFSPCMRYVATGSEDSHAYIYDLRMGTQAAKLHGHTDVVSSVAFNPLYPQIITASYDGSLRFFTTTTTKA